MAALDQSNEFRESALLGRLNFLNTGAGAATVEIYPAPRAASVADAPANPALVVFELDDPAGAVAAGVLTLLPTEAKLVLVSGDAVWARVRNGTGAVAMDMDCGDTTSTAPCKLSQLSLYEGGTVALVSAVLR